ncbi:hypothetical protein L3X38_011572 [Prunus dulcis]|uniref:Uncharacterized protein n=1 Tax=Prunus dulcis TaxID=3755 RepID=A0AAD4WK47_PRUDU|nr:hypothetical protein L3X38_011572 [Prunus dulcis]
MMQTHHHLQPTILQHPPVLLHLQFPLLLPSSSSLWLAQISPILRSHDLFGYVDGSVPCPPKHLLATNTSILNPAYLNWVQQDQTILSWINNSLSPTVLATVTLSPTSRKTWESLKRSYASTSHNRILHLRNELLRTIKGDMSISEFLDKMNLISDNLPLVGSLLTYDDLVFVVMNNVRAAFEVTVSIAQACDAPITYEALGALLLSAERHIGEQSQLIPNLNTGITTFVASCGHGNRGRSPSRNFSCNINYAATRGPGQSRSNFPNQRSFSTP